jgi:tRNA(Ile)-lysidine synthase
MFEEFKSHLINELPFLFNNKILIATSSGVDSVVLCTLCNDLGLNFSIAHCNFSLRGEESDEDAEFAKALAKLLNVDFYLKKFNTISYKENRGLSTQMAARELRYKWFDDLLINYDCLLTAHHLDDQLETFLINLSRGSGLGGLLGIPIINKKKIRPLLNFSKNQIVNYARENNISWREDSSNLSNDYLRNEIRNNVIPEFKKSAPDLLKKFNKSLNYLKNSKSYIQEKINETSKKIIFDEGHQVKYDIKEILRLDNLKMYLFEFFHKFGFNQLTDIENILNSQSGKQILSKTHRIVKDRGFLILEEISNMSFVSIDVRSDTAQVDTIYGSLFFNLSLNFEKSIDPSSVYVDLGKLVYPLRVEVYSKGMEFIPFGMSGKKSLSKFFKDKKLSIIDKNRSLVLVNGNNELIWVVNQRMDDRYKITESTSRILKISFN